MKELDFIGYLVVSLYYVGTYDMKTQKHPAWALAHKKPGTELRFLHGNYYLYANTSVYGKEKKRDRKISGPLLGRISEKQGFIPSGKRKLEQALDARNIAKPHCKEYGVSLLINRKFSRTIDLLSQFFPDHWKLILAIAYCRLVYHCPLKNIPFRLSQSFLPVYYRLLPGNIREVKAFKNCLLEAGLKDAVIVADKGFYSKKNVDLLLAEKLRFILLLKRDNTLIDYSLLANNTFKKQNQYFVHEKRIIWFQEYSLPWDKRQSMFLFLDESLRIKEEQDYLVRIATHPDDHSIDYYHERRHAFGTLTLLTGIKRKPAEVIYQGYKSRMTIEVLFDGMKNVLEADHTYMQNEQTLEGWMFVNHITLQWYQQLYSELKAKGLLKLYSVNDYIQLLTDLKKISINGEWHFNEITKTASRMMQKLGVSYE